MEAMKMKKRFDLIPICAAHGLVAILSLWARRAVIIEYTLLSELDSLAIYQLNPL